MNLWNTYHLARSVKDALQTLVNAPGPARFIAGGTDLLLDLQQGREAPVHTLVDVTEIPELQQIEIRKGEIFVGAGVPHRQIVEHPLICQHAQALSEACGLIGGPQVRNTATLGGNVAHALPAADGMIALLSLGAEAEVAALEGSSRVALLDLFAGPGKSTLYNQLLTGFYLPLAQAHSASAFQRVMRPQGVAIAILNLGLWLRREGDRIADIRIAVGPAGPVPRRMTAAEDVLRGAEPNDSTLQAALDALLGQARFRTSRHRATQAYRQHVVGVLLADTLQRAYQRAELAS